jgi:hypothetical protein
LPVFFSWLLLPNALAAQSTEKVVTMETYFLSGNPLMHSFGRSILYDSAGRRIYNVQIILAHQVADETIGIPRFSSTVVSDIGYANSGTGEMSAIRGDCYLARIASHVNTYDLHEIVYSAQSCMPVHEQVQVPKENCPVLLDLAQDGFRLSGLTPAVSFDIDADGVPDRISWTRADGDDAFLCLDRNQNGIIDNGSELFGYVTPLLSGKPAKIGYRALAELDQSRMGGNGDGRVDASDSMFSSLCAWIDKNRNGTSEPSELFSLDQVGVASLNYGYEVIHLVDPFGNLFRYKSEVSMRMPSGGERSWPTYDVIFSSPERAQ